MKLNYRKKSLKLLLTLSLGLCVAHTGYAAPSGGTVMSGNANISDPSNITLTGTNYIHWQQFGIGANETVNFNSNGVPFAVLNRVVSSDVSNILGTLNGQGGTVFLLNPNGIVFGAGATINTASFIASTLYVNDDAVMNLLNGGTADFIAGTRDCKISFTGSGSVDFKNSNSIFMGKSIEINPGVNLNFGNSASFLAGPNINITNTPSNGNFNMTDMRITLPFGPTSGGATADNLISIKGDLTTNNGNISILGGKVTIDGNITSAKDLFIAGGNLYRFRKDANGNYGFSFTNRHTNTDNTVTIAENTTITTTGKAGILANSITNDGTLKVGDKLEISALNSMMSDYDGNDNLVAGHITSTEGNKFTNTGTIEAGKMEILAGAIDNSGTLKTTTGDIFLTSANNITIVPNQAYNGMDKYQVNNATDTNLIKSTGTIESNGILTMLGGKVDINGKVSSEGDMFIAAGKTYSLVKDEGDFWFGYDKMSTSAGNTVTIAQGATVSSNNETGILANSVTNNGTITVDDQNGLAMYVVEDMQTTFDTSGKPVSANIVTSKNNKITNTGTVTVSGGGRVDIMANAIDNQGTITTTRGDVVLTGNLTGNAIANIKSQVADDKYTGILMTGDSNGEPVYSFINPVQIPEVEKGSDLESAINQAMDILAQQGATPEVKAQATLDIIKGHATAGIEGSKEITKATPILTTVNESSPANNLSPTDNNTASNLTIENQEVE